MEQAHESQSSGWLPPTPYTVWNRRSYPDGSASESCVTFAELSEMLEFLDEDGDVPEGQ